MKQVITIQHCQSEHHVNGMMGSWNDWELTEMGREQARRLGERLGAELAGQTVKIYSSDLKRAAQTAAPLARKLGVAVEYRQELRERSHGPESIGKTSQWFAARMGRDRYIDDRPMPGSETRRELYQRLEPLCREVLACPEDTVVLVSHGGTLMVWNTLWLGLPPEAMDHCSLRGRSGGIGRFDIYDGWSRRITCLGDLTYIQG
ncbi:histidine phosphatase family protein [Acutalibacter caecimuris]|uniref:histidine phosphatase family protein n=1 Tax=Acutalibacter caecimuris TaxID=3093657 RepID=UPI002AC90076|nr:histidine phosphatase family protein [Acutalibacter sp. M00118]